ncbi:MAG: glutamate mutase L [Ktedonobacterales bacterium]
MGGAVETLSVEGAGHRPTYATRSLLVVDCGSVFTKVALLSVVEDQYRLVARSQAATTLTAPQADLSIGARDAIFSIERVVGRPLLRAGQLITPEQTDGSGVDGVALVTSVGGPMKLLVAGPGREALAGFMYRAIGGLFTQVEPLPNIYPDATGQSPEWRQALAQVESLHPHALLVIGAPFGSAHSQANTPETGKNIKDWLDCLYTDSNPSSHRQATRLPIIFTGSADDAPIFTKSLGDRSQDAQSVEALSPSTLSPLNRAVNALYEGSVLHDLPGYVNLRALSSAAPAASVTALGGMVRYLAQHFQTNVVGVDVGASSTALSGATARGEFLPAGQPNAGVGPGAGAILRARGVPQIMQWLSFVTSEDEVREYILMRMLRPRALPSTTRELEFEHALAREAIQMASRAPGSRLGGLHPLDVVLGSGGVLSNAPHPAMAAMILMDALQPRGITSLVLDTAHLANMLGSVAILDAIATAEVAEQDAVLLQLGTLISTVGTPEPGQPLVRVTLEYADGRQHSEEILPGTLTQLPLQPGEQAILGLYPAPSVDVGLGPGQQARASEPVEGGTLGLILDARGRPLMMPADPVERVTRVRQWHQALGLEA